MAGLDPAICRGTALSYYPRHGAGIDGRVKPGHDGWGGRCRYVKHFAGWYEPRMVRTGYPHCHGRAEVPGLDPGITRP